MRIKDIRGTRFLGEVSDQQPTGAVMSQVRQVLREVEEAQRQEVGFRENWTPDAHKAETTSYYLRPAF